MNWLKLEFRWRWKLKCSYLYLFIPCRDHCLQWPLCRVREAKHRDIRSLNWQCGKLLAEDSKDFMLLACNYMVLDWKFRVHVVFSSCIIYHELPLKIPISSIYISPLCCEFFHLFAYYKIITFAGDVWPLLNHCLSLEMVLLCFSDTKWRYEL